MEPTQVAPQGAMFSSQIGNYLCRDVWLHGKTMRALYTHARKPARPGRWFIAEVQTNGLMKRIAGNSYIVGHDIKAPIRKAVQ